MANFNLTNFQKMKPKALLTEKSSLRLTDVVQDMMINRAIRDAGGDQVEDTNENGRQRANSMVDE